MDIAEVVAVLRYIEQKTIVTNLTAQYSQLLASLQQLVQNPQQGNGPREQFNGLREAILKTQAAADPPADWSEMRRNIFESFGAKGVLGKAGAEALDDALSRNVANPRGAAQAVQPLHAAVNNVTQRAAQVLASLGPLAQPPERERPDSRAAVVILIFQHGVSVEQLSDLHEWSGKWDWTFKTFGRLTHSASESPRLVDLQRGSVLVFLGAAAGVALVMAKATEKLISAVEKAMSARKLAAEAKKLELANLTDAVAKELESAADKEMGQAVNVTINMLIQENNWPAGQERNELESHLRTAVDTMREFIDGGGRVDFRLPAATDSPKDAMLLEDARATQARITATSSRVHQLADELDHIRQLSPASAPAERPAVAGGPQPAPTSDKKKE